MIRRRNLLKGSAALGASSILGGSVLAKSAPKLWVPPEEDPHLRTFMQWPVDRRVHPDRYFLDLLQETIADIANAVADFEPVVVLAAKQN